MITVYSCFIDIIIVFSYNLNRSIIILIQLLQFDRIDGEFRTLLILTQFLNQFPLYYNEGAYGAGFQNQKKT